MKKDQISAAASVMCLLLLVGTLSAHAVTWTINIPVKGGDVGVQTTSPSQAKSLTSSAKVTFLPGSDVEIIVQPNPGFVLVQALMDGTPIMFRPGNDALFTTVYQDSTIEIDFAGSGSSVPTGKFSFSFPSGNTTLVPVFDVTGNYKGITPSIYKRAYDLDVAMDEFGKVQCMGTIAGYAQAVTAKQLARAGTFSTQLSGQVGSVKTVNKVATGLFKTTFTGQRDGSDAAFSGTITGPLAPAALSGGGTGLSGTGTFKGKLGDVPYDDKNMPVQVPLDSSSNGNLKKAWTIALTIQQKQVKGKSMIVASALLTLPNGTVISFPEHSAKYSSTKGYSLSLKQGTNTTLVPNATDKATSVSIKGLLFMQTQSGFVVAGGTIAYKFLGQQGSGNLAEFTLQQ